MREERKVFKVTKTKKAKG